MLNSQFQSWSVFTDEVCFWLEKPGGCVAPGAKESKSFLSKAQLLGWSRGWGVKNAGVVFAEEAKGGGEE